MTALCGGGSSSAKSGFARLLFVAPAVAGAALNNVPTAVALALAAAIGSKTYDLQNFCTVDPPPMPTIDEGDILSLFNPTDIFRYNDAFEKFSDLIGNYVWRMACQCNADPQPAAPTPPPALVNFDPTPPFPVSTASGCANIERVIRPVLLNHVDSTSGPAHSAYFVHETFGLQPGPIIPAGGYSGPWTSVLIPAGATHLQYIITTLSGGPPPVSQPWLTSAIFNAGNTLIQGFAVPQVGSDGTTVTGPVLQLPNGAHHLYVVADNSPTHDFQIDLNLTFFCNNQTNPTVTQPCCPPDLSLSAQIQQILGYVTLIQRQNAPFAYIRSTEHTGLTGSGHIAVQGLIGCIATMTTTPPNVGIEAGDPLEYWRAGWINWGNADGSSKKEWLSVSPQTSFPNVAGQYTRIGYSLQPGVEITITELTREP